jgi:hypothetical protein
VFADSFDVRRAVGDRAKVGEVVGERRIPGGIEKCSIEKMRGQPDTRGNRIV